jgi:hypothetical protein
MTTGRIDQVAIVAGIGPAAAFAGRRADSTAAFAGAGGQGPPPERPWLDHRAPAASVSLSYFPPMAASPGPGIGPSAGDATLTVEGTPSAAPARLAATSVGDLRRLAEKIEKPPSIHKPQQAPLRLRATNGAHQLSKRLPLRRS